MTTWSGAIQTIPMRFLGVLGVGEYGFGIALSRFRRLMEHNTSLEFLELLGHEKSVLLDLLGALGKRSCAATCKPGRDMRLGLWAS